MKSSPNSTHRRRQILDAALDAFLEYGYAATSVAHIRSRSGASTGSIYHFFSGKGALAEALLREAVADWGAAAARDPSASAEDAIKASVHGLVVWGLANPQRLRFMDELRSLAVADSDFAGVRDLLAQGQAASAAQYAGFATDGAVRDLPWPVAYALILGPAYTYLRQAKPLSPDDAETIATLFADAAWQTVRQLA